MTLPALEPITLLIDQTTIVNGGPYIGYWEVEHLGLSGQFSGTNAPVSLSFTAVSNMFTANIDNSGFYVDIPVAGQQEWAVLLTEDIEGGRSATTTLITEQDTAAPLITLLSSAEESTESVILLSGSVTDDISGVVSIAILNTRISNESFFVFTEEDGGFTSDIPLEYGDNSIVINAIDAAGNQAQTSIAVVRTPQATPALLIESPANNSSTNQETISLSGAVYTALPKDAIDLTVDDQPLALLENGGSNKYTFLNNELSLDIGLNIFLIKAESSAGNAEQSLIIYRTDPNTTPGDSPAIRIVRPLSGAYTNADSSDLLITINAPGRGEPQVQIAGEQMLVQPLQTELWYVNQIVPLSSFAEGEIELPITVSFGAETFEEKLIIVKDTIPPALNITQPGSIVLEQQNIVTQNPLIVIAEVTDPNLASVLVNGTSVPVAGGTINFNVPLENALPKSIGIHASDYAGNTTVQSFDLLLDASVNIEPVFPSAGQTVTVANATSNFNLSVRAVGDLSNVTVVAAFPDGAEVSLQENADQIFTTPLASPAIAGLTEIIVQAQSNDDNSVLGSVSIPVEFVFSDDLPVELLKVEPLANQQNVEANEVISLYFNKAIDASLLDIQVNESIHGEVYSSDNGEQFLEFKNPTLVQVHYDMQAVSGGITVFPENKVVSFYPAKSFEYGADIFVDVVYDDTALARYQFAVEPLPTFVTTNITDQFGRPVDGIKIALQGTEQEANSTTAGNAGFRFGNDLSESIDGNYILEVNPGRLNPDFGESRFAIQIDNHNYNTLSSKVAPLLNRNNAPRLITNQTELVSLSGGDFNLDLSNAIVEFEAGGQTGHIRAQRYIGSEIYVPAASSATSSWAFGIQPVGATISGILELSLSIPVIDAGSGALPESGTLALLTAYSSTEHMLIPIAAAPVENGVMAVSIPVDKQPLDFFSVVNLSEEQQQQMQALGAEARLNSAVLRGLLEQ